MANNLVPGTPADGGIDPATLIPTSHIPAALSTAARTRGVNPQVLNMLTSMQAQITALMNGQTALDDRPDVVMVNPGGRIVEISGELSDEYLAKPGFRKATPEEEANYRRAMLRQTPEFLRRQEKKRLQAEAAMYDEIEQEDSIAGVNTAALLRAPVTSAQKTGAISPEDLAARNAGLTVEHSPTSDKTEVSGNQDDNDGTPLPRRRGSDK